jgi:hypothetical protein
LILCTHKGAAQAHYALDGLPNKVMAAQYQTVLPDEQVLVDCLQRTQTELARRSNQLINPSTISTLQAKTESHDVA